MDKVHVIMFTKQTEGAADELYACAIEFPQFEKNDNAFETCFIVEMWSFITYKNTNISHQSRCEIFCS